MVYITVKNVPVLREMTLEELLFATTVRAPSEPSTASRTSTRTYRVDEVSDRVLATVNVPLLISKLVVFNQQTEELRSKPRQEQYRTFYQPKKSGRGFRRIDAPEPEMMSALRNLKQIFEEDFHALYHTSAFAYIKRRCTLDALKKHQANESKWFGKYDLSDFFGSTTLEFVMSQLSMIFPFSEVVKYTVGKQQLETALELAFLNGGLPQGTPISPLITNVMMIPIDHALTKRLRDFNGQPFIYTRYADDFIISSRRDFDVRAVESLITSTLEEFNAPFKIKKEKTTYGSSAGRNKHLGVVLNANNDITIGYKKKKEFQAMLTNYALDRINGTPWSKVDTQVLEGHRNYYRMVEKETIDKMVEHISKKVGLDIVSALKSDLKV